MVSTISALERSLCVRWLRLLPVLSFPTVLVCSVSARPERVPPPEITFTVSMSRPYTHLLEVELQVVQPAATENVDLVMPVWTPGSYLIREYERNVQDFAAVDVNWHAPDWTKNNHDTS